MCTTYGFPHGGWRFPGRLLNLREIHVFFFGGGGGSQLDKCDFPILTLGKNGGRGVHSRMCFLFSGISPRFSVYFRIKECP